MIFLNIDVSKSLLKQVVLYEFYEFVSYCTMYNGNKMLKIV